MRELKDVEHIYNVTLKNNRSLETVKLFLKAVANLYDKLIEKYLEKVTDEVPRTPLQRLELFIKKFKEENVSKYIEEYKIIRKCLLSKAKVIDEHRRNMRVIFEIDGKEIEYTIKSLKGVLERAREFYNIMEKYIK